MASTSKKAKLNVSLTKLDPSFVDIRMSKDVSERSQKIFSELMAYHISSLIGLQMPNEFSRDFPDDIVPPKLKYKPGITLHQTPPKTVVKRERSLLKEAEKIVGTTPVERKRRTRYNGDYSALNDIEIVPAPKQQRQPRKRRISSESSNVSSHSSYAEQLPGTSKSALKLNTKGKVKSHAKRLKLESKIFYSTSTKTTVRRIDSYDSDNNIHVPPTNEVDAQNKLKKLYGKTESSPKKHKPVAPVALQVTKSLSDSSDDEEAAQRPVLETVLNEPLEIIPKSIPTAIKTSVIKPPVAAIDTEKAVNKPVVKLPVVVSKDYKVPPLIEPPSINPRTKKPVNKSVQAMKKPVPLKTNKVKVDSKKNDLRKLGGIFGIDNGWDKKTEEVKKKTNEILKLENVPQNIPPHVQPIKRIEFINNDAPKNPKIQRAPIIAPPKEPSEEKKPGKFDRCAESSDESDDDPKYTQFSTKTKSVFSDSEDGSQQGSQVSKSPVKKVCQSDEDTDEPNAKRQKTEETSNDEPPTAYDDDDRISLVADNIDFGDLDDSPVKKPPMKKRAAVTEDPVYTTSLDELKMKFQKESIMSPQEAEAAFKLNTDKIMQNALKGVDEATGRIFKRFYGVVCPAYLEGTCTDTNCKNGHRLKDAGSIRVSLQGCSLKEVDEAYGVATKFSKIYEPLVPAFAEIYIKRSDYKLRLPRMILDCERNARSHQNYIHILDALTVHAKMPRYKAIKFLIEHHTDSSYAQEMIMSIIVDERTGPDLIRVLDYLIDLQSKRTLPIKIVDKIVLNCLQYQDPRLPTFCLNCLITKNPGELRQFSPNIIQQFLTFETALLQASNSKCEEKLTALCERLV